MHQDDSRLCKRGVNKCWRWIENNTGTCLMGDGGVLYCLLNNYYFISWSSLVPFFTRNNIENNRYIPTNLITWPCSPCCVFEQTLYNSWVTALLKSCSVFSVICIFVLDSSSWVCRLIHGIVIAYQQFITIDDVFFNGWTLVLQASGGSITTSTTSSGATTIAELLARNHAHCPPWLLVVCTARRQSRSVTRQFAGFRKVVLDDLRKAHVVRDVQQYILCRLDRDERLRLHLSRETAELLNQLHIKCNGCFLYLEKVS